MDVSRYRHADSITIDRPPKDLFAFVNYGPDGDVELVRWGYAFEPRAGAQLARDGIKDTLANLKRVAESVAGASG
jgi:hypothetical protein